MKLNSFAAFKKSCSVSLYSFRVQITGLIAIVLISLLIYSCSKDNAPIAVKSSPTANNDHKQTLDFIAKAQTLKEHGNISTRDGEGEVEIYYTAQPAIDQLNDALNLNYCRPSEEYATMEVHKDSTNLILDPRGNISETDLMILYDQMAMTAGSHFYAFEDNTKETFAFDVVQANNLNGNVLPVYVYFFMTKGTCPAPSSYPYGVDDDWEYGFNAGNCNNPGDPYDAADLFRCDLRKNKIYKGIRGHSYYFTERYSTCFSRWESIYCGAEEIDYNAVMPDQSVGYSELINVSDQFQNDNYYDFYLFNNDSNHPNSHTCISDPEMNFYYEKMADLSTNFIPNGKVIGNIEVGYQVLIGVAGHSFHSMRVDYWKVNEAIGIGNEVLTKTELPCPEPPC